MKLLVKIILSALFCLMIGLGFAQPPIAIRNVSVVDVSAATSQIRTVLIRNGNIEAILATENKIKKEYQLIDGTAKFLIPGLINSYTHIHELNTSLYLLNGITTVRDAPSMGHLPGLAKRIQDRALVGPEVFTTGNALSGIPTAFPTQHPIATEQDARLAVKESKRMRQQSLMIYGSMSKEMYPYILDEATKQQIMVTGHFPSQVPLDIIKSGQQRSFDNLSGLIRSGNWRYDSTIMKELFSDMVEKNRYLIPTLTIHKVRANAHRVAELLQQDRMKFVPPRLIAEWSDLTNSPFVRSGYNYEGTLQLMKLAYQMGVNILPGSDGGFPLVVDGFAFVDELENLKEVGMSNAEILQSATSRAAEFLNLNNRIGSIAVNKEADLLLLNKNPLDNILNVRSIEGLLLNGKWFSYEELLQLAEQQKIAMHTFASPIKTHGKGTLLEIFTNKIKIGEELILIDTVDNRVRVSSHNYMQGPYYRDTKTDFYLTNNQWDSMRVRQDRIDGKINILVNKVNQSAIVRGSIPFFGDFSYSLPSTSSALFVGGPIQAFTIPCDVWVNYFLLAKKAFAIDNLKTITVPLLQIELNGEEFGERHVYDVENYRVTKLPVNKVEEIQIIVTQPSALGEDHPTFNPGEITVLVTLDLKGNIIKMEANTANGRIDARSY